MAKAPKVLVAGESWTVHSIHQKGFDSFTTTEYAEGIGWLRDALVSGGWDFHHMPAHAAARDFPTTVEELAAYDCVILSDVGTNTLLIHPETFTRFKSLPNRLVAIRDYAANGGGLIMVGGYMTFQGIDGKARYHGTPVEEALPVDILPHDDRAETPEGGDARSARRRSSDRRGSSGPLAEPTGLQSGHRKGLRGDFGSGRRRPADRRRRLRQGARRGLRLRLRSALGAA